MGDFLSILGKTLNSVVVVFDAIAPIAPISRIVDINSFFNKNEKLLLFFLFRSPFLVKSWIKEAISLFKFVIN